MNTGNDRFYVTPSIKVNQSSYENPVDKPIGLMPKDVYREMYRIRRIQDILDAMERYSDSNYVIPVEWVIELRELLNIT
jgi:hypothetical protein